MAGLALALILFLLFAALYRFSSGRFRTPPVIPLTDTETVSEFQRRRGRLLYFGVIPFVAAVCGTLVIGPIPYYPLQHDVEPVLVLLALLSGMSAISLALLIYRCPRCTRIPRGERFVDLNPEVCPGCGTRLKRPASF